MLKELKRKINKMNNEYLNKMKEIEKTQYNTLRKSDAQQDADILLVDFVEKLGFKEIAKSYRNVSKYYSQDYMDEERYGNKS